MTLKKYQTIKSIFAFTLALAFSQAIIFENYLIPIILMISGALILMRLRRRVSEVMADERDYATGGKAALLVIQIYSWIAAIFMTILYAGRDLNPAYEPIALTLAFSTCFLLLLYAFIFRYYNHFKFSDKKLIYKILMISLFFIILVFALRLFSGEDDWMCVNGSWQPHGHPSFPAPTAECQ